MGGDGLAFANPRSANLGEDGMPNVNPRVLAWARETAGLSRDDAVKRLQLGDARGVAAVDRLAALETGTDHPTRPMLAKMAKQYRRPLITFYLDGPPRNSSRGTDFRTLPSDRPSTQDALVQALVRDVLARQGIVRAQLEDDDVDEVEFIGSAAISEGWHAVLRSLETIVNGTSLGKTGKRRPGFNVLRANVERRGVFVLLQGDLGSHHTDLETDAFRGFALADRLAPFIVINDNDARTAWSFTLLHEMVHLLLGNTGISGSGAETQTEWFCNDVASEYLLPQSAIGEFAVRGVRFDQLVESLGHIAADWNVSRALIAYRLHRSRRIDAGLYRRLAETFRRQWVEERERVSPGDGGPNYYTVRRHRVGKALLDLVNRGLGEGSLPTTKAAVVLGVKPTQVGQMLRMKSTA